MQRTIDDPIIIDDFGDDDDLFGWGETIACAPEEMMEPAMSNLSANCGRHDQSAMTSSVNISSDRNNGNSIFNHESNCHINLPQVSSNFGDINNNSKPTVIYTSGRVVDSANVPSPQAPRPVPREVSSIPDQLNSILSSAISMSFHPVTGLPLHQVHITIAREREREGERETTDRIAILYPIIYEQPNPISPPSFDASASIPGQQV
jgi:hypothetical protein